MLYDYVVLGVFALLGMLIPASLLISSKILGFKSQGNKVKNAPWESAEESVGESLDIDNEYLPFFSIFLPFEIIAAIFIVWASQAKNIAYNQDVGVIVLATLSAFVVLGFYKLAARDKHGEII